MKKMLSVMVVYNLPEKSGVSGAAESDIDTVESAEIVSAALIKSGYQTHLLGIDINDLGKLRKINTDIVFNLIEWTGVNTKYALEAIDIYEKQRIAYTGSGKFGYRVSCDKREMKQLFNRFKIPTPEAKIFDGSTPITFHGLNFPLIIKPAREHCGIAIDQTSVVSDARPAADKIDEVLRMYQQPVLAEEYIEGREVHVTVLEKNGRPWVLPPAEVMFRGKGENLPILTYKAKWRENTQEYRESVMLPAKLDAALETKIQKIARDCYQKLDGKDYPRLDMRIDSQGRVYVLEINNNPGIDYDGLSGIGVSARLAGMTFENLVSHIVENAYMRFAQRRVYAAY